MYSYLSKQLNKLLDILFPQKCLSCGTFGEIICNACKTKSLVQAEHYCHVCKESVSKNEWKHKACESALDGVFVCYKYNKVIEKLISEIKYKQYFSLTHNVSEVMLEKIDLFQIIASKAIFTSVPLHRKKLWSRGFNQAERISREIANRLGANYQELLDRTKNTKTQVGMKRNERLINLNDAFGIRKQEISDNTTIIIVDDIMTTGTTLENCGVLLRLNYPKSKIFGLVFARG